MFFEFGIEIVPEQSHARGMGEVPHALNESKLCANSRSERKSY